ncbi:ATP-grasp domain-containing protein [Methylicorpusculum oleiharenae]|uniref:ATP-grasp domain-containing protein n=1 Tax=Methylicorpusculum oleiharenae TaxID=1338687 RepID=UPI001359E46D|nr:ATP-grasp domain-containing protein [Methylicorpusculum oleiharenae]MCD2452867.1 ATP-grasp domain-containing protein [Methylicorpusculum oleiharenae]
MRIWFNKTFSSIHSVLRNLRQADYEKNITLIISHIHRHAPGMAVADESYIEPDDLSDEQYLEWALRFCRQHRIDWFWPGKAAAIIAQNQDRFLADNVRILLVAEPAVLALLNDKAAFYAVLGREIALPPDAVAVNSLSEFDQAFNSLRIKHPKLCVKPAVSVFGLGFRIIDESRSSITHLLKGIEHQIALSELRFGMERTPQFETLLVMEYLPGHEWSVDCVATNGKLWCAVQRKKPLSAGLGQIIDDNPDIAAMVQRLTRHYRLNGLFNIQFKEGIFGPRLLEINARPSGGVGMACLSGVNLAKIALQTVLSNEQIKETQIMDINFGRYVSEINTPVTLEAL